MSHKLKQFILFLGDLAVLHLALLLTLIVRYLPSEWRAHWPSHWNNFVIIFAIWLLLFYINDLYNLNLRALSRKFFRQTVNASLLSALLSVLYFYLNVKSTIAPRTNLAIFIVFFILLFFIWRALHQLTARAIPLDNLAIIGLGPKTDSLLKELAARPGSGYKIALSIKTPEELNDLPNQIKTHGIKAIVVCDDFGRDEELRQALFACLSLSLNFYSYPEFYESLTGKIPVEAIGPDWFLDNLREGRKNYFDFFKRVADLVLALIILIVSLPFWLIFAFLIMATSRGPIFFRQTRLGKNEKLFKIIKFRTMRVDGNDGAPTLAVDKRVTLVGRFLRRTRLDEIPQTMNIIKGQMSFIGPRPEQPKIAGELEDKIPFYKTRLLIKPGLTGWDQVSGEYHSPSKDDTLEKLQYDLFYLKHRSLYLDIIITLKTIATVLSRGGL